ncbi:TNF receptor-associated factor 3 isoform X2 [Cylas formicarius]|uniref:TNF receptor-associated factor 3 isoform X2 n=1 Tax=Cylas formicarius TaxID=197179 RepID=UPI0029587715|nr:TNF receptor-associated factor 3 isoform X2 [Cylas formicarius]
METGQPKSKFVCYFCQRTIENETEVGHASVCSNVLVPCPRKCGSYVSRANLPKHQYECVNQKTATPKTSPSNHRGYPAKHSETNSLDRTAVMTKTVFQEELARLSKRVQDLETRRQQSSIRSSQQFTTLAGHLDTLKTVLTQHTSAIEKINHFHGFHDDWRRNLENRLEKLASTALDLEQLRGEIDSKLPQLQNLNDAFHHFKEATLSDRGRSQSVAMDFARNIEDLRGLIERQASDVSALWSEHLQTTSVLRGDVDEQRAKHTSLVFDLRSVSHIASEAAEKVELLERDFGEMKHDVEQLKVDVAVMEGLGSGADETWGSVLWKISDFDSKLKAAKDSGVVLKSVPFYTHRYGYRIRLLLYLNGLNKWRDRYALACIHVLKGDYDMLLPWPCSIEGSMILRDLENVSKPKSFSKYIKAKRNCGDEEAEEPQESSSTYIFIPHSVLLKGTYLKNDTVFVEVRINPFEKQETSL